MWTDYSARAAGQLIGMSESVVRSCVRDGLLAPSNAGQSFPLRLSFRDLASLRAIKQLIDAGISTRKLRSVVQRLQTELAPGQPLAELPLQVQYGEVYLRGVAVSTAPQLVLPLGSFGPHGQALGPARPQNPGAPLPYVGQPTPANQFPAATGELVALKTAAETLGLTPLPLATADDWFARGLALEESDPAQAIEAFQKGLELRPDAADAWVNLGRLLAEKGESVRAHTCFQHAIQLDPSDPTNHYNLGVVAQDEGRETEAIDLYIRALELDPSLADAHYNLATLYDQSGNAHAAIRHINEYRKLTRSR